MGSVTKFLEEEWPKFAADPNIKDWVFPTLCLMLLLKDLGFSSNMLEETAKVVEHRVESELICG